MTENITKVVSARVPLANYLQIAAAAGEKKMTVADYVLLKLFAHPDSGAEPLRQATEQVKHLATQVSTLTGEKAEFSQAIQSWQKHAGLLQQTQQATATELQQAKHQGNQLSQALAQQQAQATILAQQLQTEQAKSKALQQRLQDLRQALIDEHNSSRRLGGISDKYWAIIDHFIPEE